MRKTSILLIMLYASLMTAMLPSPVLAQDHGGEHRIILLGARWCAPCMVEWRNLPQLAAAVAPDRIVLAWVDRPIPVPPALAPQVSSMPAAEAQALALRHGGQGFGLPMVLIVEEGGKVCSVWRRPLTVGDLAEAYRPCRDR
jgi:thiol-disulfide isomerase/thioredoxin